MGHSHTNILIIAVCVCAVFLLILLVVILVTTVLLFGRWKQKRGIIITVTCYYSGELWHIYTFPGATVTDHIPVDNNPVYVTMKKIDMNKNSAYEVVHLKANMN